MIKFVTDSSIFNIVQTPYSVIINPVNTDARFNYGIVQLFAKKYPAWYKDFHDYCQYFKANSWQKSHEDELIGTFHRFNIDKNVILCSTFGQILNAKRFEDIDYDAYEKIFRKIDQQTRKMLNCYKQNWIIHIPGILVRDKKGNEDAEMLELIGSIFKNSSTEVLIY